VRNLLLIAVLSTLPTLLGCRAIGDALWDSIFPGPKRGTSKEPGISDKERQARWEEENIREALRRFNEPSPPPPPQADWEKIADEALR
jgi:hypothetical protein